MIPQWAGAQTASIAGTVKDATGAVLPGVTVESSSAVLIEKVRTTLTDREGRYQIVELRPGTFTVTFRLVGFSAVKREGIELTAGFAATINAELGIGEMTETITVTEASPIVDVQNTRQQIVMTREVMDAIPTGRLFANFGALIPGMSVSVVGQPTPQDVGGTAGYAHQTMAIHGGRQFDQSLLLDGMPITTVAGGAGAISLLAPNTGAIEETSLEVAAGSAEADTGGVRINMIPKSGGNTYDSSLFATFANGAQQSDNLSNDLQAKGLPTPNKVRYMSDLNASVGGPIVRDRLWFFGSYRDARRVNNLATFYDLNPADFVYTPNPARQAEDDQTVHDVTTRHTWQVSRRNKVNFLAEYNQRCDCHFYQLGALVKPEASVHAVYLNRLGQATWLSPVSNRWLLEAGLSLYQFRLTGDPQPEAVGPHVRDADTGFLFRAAAFGTQGLAGYRVLRGHNYAYRAAVSYVTGTHALKVGFIENPGETNFHLRNLSDYEIALLKGSPTSVTFLPTPTNAIDAINKFGLFAQDQWKMSRLTLNLGLRLDWFKSHFPDIDIPATRILPRRQFAGRDVLNWKDLSPRLGASYDLLGNGKTAVKASVSRYVIQEGTDLTRAADPAVATAAPLTRTWNDLNEDFIPQGDALNPAAHEELGPSPNSNFGKTVLSLRYEPTWATGFNTRPAQWETSTGIQHELLPRVSLSGTYFRRVYTDFMATDNLLIDLADYDPYCITSPTDSRLPNGGGQEICGLFDLKPAKRGQVDNLVTSADTYGRQIEHWNGIDFAVTARLPNGILLQGGTSTGKTTTDQCDLVKRYPDITLISSPIGTAQSTDMCHLETPFLTQTKFLGSLTLPWQVQIAGTFQSSPGAAISANYIARNAVIVPSLRRNLSSGATGTVTVNLVPPGTMYGERLYQTDVRISRTFTAGRAKVKGMIDLYNVTNGNAVLVWNNSYGTDGASWLVPQQINSGRLVKFAIQVDF